MSTLIKDPSKRGKFIVIYGANNIGKTTQIRLVADALIKSRHDVLVIKYPLYNLKPTGPKINKIIRDEVEVQQKMTPELDLQKIYVQNRRDFQEQLITILNSGVDVLAEDYVGTGIAWGMVQGLTLKVLESLNRGLIKPDLAILLDGERFKEGIELKHRYENAEKWWARIRQLWLFGTKESWSLSRETHQMLAKRYGWKLIKTNEEPNFTHQVVWREVEMLFS